jgi:hypothetical protein
MGRPQSSAVWKHFTKDGTKNSKCTIAECQAPIVGSQKAANLKAHLKVYHKDEHAAVLKDDAKAADESEPVNTLPPNQQTLKFMPQPRQMTKSE